MTSINNVRLSLKIDDLSNWNNLSTVLNNGELALIQQPDNKIKIKVGDGSTQINDLEYINESDFFTKILSTQTHVNGIKNTVDKYSVAEGHMVSALGAFSHAEGFNAEVKSDDNFAFVWNGKTEYSTNNVYKSHGVGTFSLNPKNDLSGIYIGENTLADILAKSNSYNLATAELVGTDCLSCNILNKTITTINISESISKSEKPIIINIPEKTENNYYARDFILNFEISETVWITFQGINETVLFISDDSNWEQLTSGTNILSFTEISTSKFLVKKQYFN